jgi:hypothetical protein
MLAGLLGSLGGLPNLIKSAGSVVTGLLDNISKGRDLDISGNLARGLRSALSIADEVQQPVASSPANIGKSDIASTGGSYAYEAADKGRHMAVDHMLARGSDVTNMLARDSRNATTRLPVVITDSGRGMRAAQKRIGDDIMSPMVEQAVPFSGNGPQVKGKAKLLPTAPAGLPSTRINSINVPSRAKYGDEIIVRDDNGYKPYVTGRNVKAGRKPVSLPRFEVEGRAVKAKKAVARRGRPRIRVL